MNSHNTYLLTTISIAVSSTSALMAAVPSSSEREAIVRVVTKWDAGCDGGSRSSWDNMANAWYQDLTDTRSTPRGHGSYAWTQGGFYKNGTIVDSDFTDTDEVAWGNDTGTDRLDSADVYMVALHGSEDPVDFRWRGKVRVDEAGSGNCRAYQGHIVLGDNDLEFLHLSSCHSMCQVDWTAWSSSFDGLHQVDGFHGLMWISTSYNDWYKDFADDGYDVPIAEAWYDNLYDNSISDSYDQCPVVRGVGLSESDLWSRMDHEQYNNVYSDPDNPTWQGWIWIGGCLPKSDLALPN